VSSYAKISNSGDHSELGTRTSASFDTLEPQQQIGNDDKALASLDETNKTARSHRIPDPLMQFLKAL
jgi:hypothetical protein